MVLSCHRSIWRNVIRQVIHVKLKVCCTEKDLFLHLLILSFTENYETVMSSVLPMDIVANHPGEGEQGIF